MVSDRYCDIAGLRHDDIVGLNDSQVLGEQFYKKLTPYYQRAFKGDHVEAEMDIFRFVMLQAGNGLVNNTDYLAKLRNYVQSGYVDVRQKKKQNYISSFHKKHHLTTQTTFSNNIC